MAAVFDRRTLVGGAAALALTPAIGRAGAAAEVWTFDRLDRIGGHPAGMMGRPTLISSPYGRAVAFDGIDDALFVADHPLAGAARFTFEALFRPDGGVFEQRWFHLEGDARPGGNGGRMLFEIRVVGAEWYLDAFIKGEGYSQVLIVPEKRHPVGRWYHVAQSYDGTTYRSYVDGALQAEAATGFTPQTPGKASVGIRLNRIWPFRGAVAKAAFTRDRALAPSAFVLPVPR